MLTWMCGVWLGRIELGMNMYISGSLRVRNVLRENDSECLGHVLREEE